MEVVISGSGRRGGGGVGCWWWWMRSSSNKMAEVSMTGSHVLDFGFSGLDFGPV